MSQGFATFLLMNNYFHDVATAMLLACAIVFWTIGKADANAKDKTTQDYEFSLRRGVMRLVWFSVAWIVVSGIIRIATVGEFEWKNFIDKGIETGLIAKYVIALVMIAVGAALITRFWHQD